MAGHSPSKTGVNALMPAIHVFLAAAQTWMPGTGLQPGRPKAGPGWPGMTEYVGQVERESH